MSALRGSAVAAMRRGNRRATGGRPAPTVRKRADRFHDVERPLERWVKLMVPSPRSLSRDRTMRHSYRVGNVLLRSTGPRPWQVKRRRRAANRVAAASRKANRS